jgi:hypothetical protein
MWTILASPAGRWLAGSLAAVLIAGAIYAKGRHDGRVVCEARAIEAIIIERERQARINDHYGRMFDDLSRELDRERAARQQAQEDRDEAARNDPHADRECLSPDSVRRIGAAGRDTP